MRYRGPERGYIEQLDRENAVTGQGRAAEEVVIDFFKRNFPNMTVRPATPREDSGFAGQGVGSKMIDAVVYARERNRLIPAMALQVTTNTSRWGIEKKMEEMKDMPFVRLPEMKSDDVAIPRALIFLKPAQVQAFTEDRDFTRHQGLVLQILQSAIRSLEFDLARTQLDREKFHIQSLLATLEQEKQKVSQNKQGKPS